MSVSLHEIATLVGGSPRDDRNPSIQGVSSVEDASEGDLVAVESEKILDRLAECRASAALVSPALAERLSLPAVVVDGPPMLALNRVVEALDLLPPVESVPARSPSIHPSASLAEDAEIGEKCSIGPFAVIGAGAKIGKGTVIRSHAVIEDGAEVGDECYIHPHAVVGSSVRIGNRVALGANAVLGASGFGFGHTKAGATRYHHVGTVEVGDDAEIGPGCTVDRARFGVTRIGAGAKLDAHVHIAHNCSIGDHTVMAAQVGLAGSTQVGARCMFGGQVGVAGHLKITDDCLIAARAGIPGDIDRPGTYFGYWAKERAVSFRELAAVAKLPAALKQMKTQEARLRQLEEAAAPSTEDT